MLMSTKFKNKAMGKWEKMEYSFNISHKNLTEQGYNDVFFTIQWGNKSYGRVLIDEIQVTEGYNFVPDVDVRVKRTN